jgi:hypothetical protein
MIWLIRFFLAMTIVGAPFVLESGYELYGLTLVYGPQMLFFSLAHTGGLLVPVLVASAICGVLAIAAGVVNLAAAAFGARPAPGTIRACASSRLHLRLTWLFSQLTTSGRMARSRV